MKKLGSFHYGELFKIVFAKAGITVKEIAEKSGHSTQAIYNIFKNKSPRIDVVLELARLLPTETKLDAIDLLLATDEETELTRKRIVDHFSESYKYIKDQNDEILSIQKGEREYYPKKLRDIERKIDGLAKELDLMKELIRTKDELIQSLKSQLNKK